jgi:predicted porin
MQLKRSTTKLLMRSALLLMVASTTANADSTLTFVGELDAYLGSNQPAGNDTDSTIGVQSNGLTTSYLGAHGSHTLSNGLTAIGAVEMFLRPDSGELGRFPNDIMFARAANAGLKGDFGQFTVGRNTSIYFLSTILFNPFGDSFSFSPMVLMSYGGGGMYGDSGWSDSLVYSTPTLGGFTSSVAYAFGEKAGDTSTNKIAANTFYKAGDFGFTAAIQKISGPQPGATGLATDDSQTDVIAGVSYVVEKNTFYAQYQLMQDDLAAGDIDRDTFVLSASLAAGTGSIYLGIGLTKTSTEASDFDRSIYTLMYNLPMSDKLDFYAGFTSDDPDAVEQKGQTLGLGGRFRF